MTSALSRRFARVPLLAILLFGCVLPVGVLVSYRTWDCARRDASIPEAPLYPNGTLLSQMLPADWENPALANYNYVTRDTPQQVEAFYTTQKAVCFLLEFERFDQTICRGNATPFGTYDVQINHGSSITYFVFISWDRCRWRFFDD